MPALSIERHVAQIDDDVLHVAAQRCLDLPLELFRSAAGRERFLRREDERFSGMSSCGGCHHRHRIGSWPNATTYA